MKGTHKHFCNIHRGNWTCTEKKRQEAIDYAAPLLWFVLTGITLIVWGEIPGVIVALLAATAIYFFLRFRVRSRGHSQTLLTGSSALEVLPHDEHAAASESAH